MIKIILYTAVIISSINLSFANTAKEDAELTQSNQGITKWILDNQEEIEKLIIQTAKVSNTIWIKDLEEQKLNQTNTKDAATKTTVPKIIPKPEQSTLKDDAEGKDNNLSNQSIITEHTVSKSQTLFAISRLYGTTVKELEDLNNLLAADLKSNSTIKVYNNNNFKQNNTTVVVPIIAQTTNKEQILETQNVAQDSNINYSNLLPKHKYYRVVAGDTFESIAKKNNMDAEDLIVLNDLKRNNILSVDAILKVKTNYQPAKQIEEQEFLWPVVGRLLTTYGPQSSGIINEGINIATKNGESIKAAQDGIVTYVGEGIKGFGNLILIQHANSFITAYAHLDTIIVKKGSVVKRGAIIAKSGKSGGVIKSQLHFEIRKDVKPVDPLDYLSSYR